MKDTTFEGLSGKIITPLSPEYNTSKQQWNRAVQKYPAAIVYCSNKIDIANAVMWSKSNGYAIRIRNGGHHYEGYSTGNGVLIIDLSFMRSITIHDDLVTVEGGVKFDQFYDQLSGQGYPFPGGNCPTVGVCGFTLGGGWGLSCRYLGLGCDNLIELELIDQRGELLIANLENNADLFWACRGAGGGNFGVIVSMTFKLAPKAEKVSLIKYQFSDTTNEKQAEFITMWQNWLKVADPKITMMSAIYHSPKDKFAIKGKGIFYGSGIDAETLLEPFINFGIHLDIEEMTFSKAMKKIEDEHPDSEKFKSTGRFVVQPLNSDEIFNLVDLLKELPEGSVYSSLTLYALGGKTIEKRSDETAFFYRDAKYIIGLQSVWENEQDAQTNKNWVDSKFKYLQSVTQGSYVNFPYSGLKNYLEAYYGSNADQLRLIKKKYDPDNVFGFPQSIHKKISLIVQQ